MNDIEMVDRLKRIPREELQERSTKAALEFWCRTLEAERDELKAQVAYMREKLEEIRDTASDPAFESDVMNWIYRDATEALSSSAGEELLERVGKLERVAEAAKAWAKGPEGGHAADYHLRETVRLADNLKAAVDALGGE